MSVKRLGGGSGNKLAAITAAVSGNLEEVTRQLERPVDRTRGVFERVSLESVRPDPDNPRSLKLSWEELKSGIADLEAARIEAGERTTRTRNLESIASKADSFKKVGQLQPIIVYPRINNSASLSTNQIVPMTIMLISEINLKSAKSLIRQEAINCGYEYPMARQLDHKTI